MEIKKTFKNICLRIKWLAHHWSIGVTIACLGVYAGLLGSLYANEIRSAFPFYRPSLDPNDYGNWVPEAVQFWSCFIVLSLVLAIRQWVSDKNKALIQSKLSSSVEKVQDLVTTMPPADFLIAFRDMYQRCWPITALADIGEPQQQEGSVRIVLDAMVALAKKWDSPLGYDPDIVVYRANIMLYRPIEDLTENDRIRLWGCKRFVVERNSDAAFASVDGFLELDIRLTTTTKTSNPDPDSEIKPLALPITFPHKDLSNKRLQNLPGAPHALVTGKPDWVLDTQKIVEICREQDSFDKVTLRDIQSYYENDEKGRSIISLPIENRYKTGQYVAVVNLYRNYPEILRDDRRASEFAAIMLPFIVLLGRLLESLVCSKQIVEEAIQKRQAL